MSAAVLARLSNVGRLGLGVPLLVSRCWRW